MTKLTKQQQKDNAYKACQAIVNSALEAYQAIARPAWKAYEAKLDEIDAKPDKVDEIITHNGREYKLIKEKK